MNLRRYFSHGAGSLLLLAVVILSSCSSDATTETGQVEQASASQPAVEQQADPVDRIVYRQSAGECQVCGYRLTIERSGTATYSANGLEVEMEVDKALFDAATMTPRDDLFIGDRDCGRQLDGNAPLLELDGQEFDLCFLEANDNHPLFTYVRDTQAVAEQDAPFPRTVRMEEQPDPLRWQEYTLDRNLDRDAEWPTTTDPGECPTFSAITFHAFGSNWVASESSGDRCLIWHGGEIENPLYDGRPHVFCAFPFSHIPVEIPAQGEGEYPSLYSPNPWCDPSPKFPGS